MCTDATMERVFFRPHLTSPKGRGIGDTFIQTKWPLSLGRGWVREHISSYLTPQKEREKGTLKKQKSQPEGLGFCVCLE